jgi:hypothetical protein
MHEFMNKSFDDLLTKATTGQYPKEEVVKEVTKEIPIEAPEIGKVKEIKKGLIKVEGEGENTKAVRDLIEGGGGLSTESTKQ